MAEEELEQNNDFLEGEEEEINPEHLADEDKGRLDDDAKEYLNERREQRKKIFKFALWLTGVSAFVLFVLIVLQVYLRVIFIGTEYENFKIMDGRTLEILSVAVFGQAISVIFIITRSLWDNKEMDLFIK